MKKTLCLFLTALATLAAGTFSTFGQETRKTTLRGNDDILTEERTVGDFSQLLVNGIFDITFIQTEAGGQPRVEITTSSNIIPFVEAVSQDGLLTLGMSEKHRYNVKKIKVRVWGPTLRGVEKRGAGDMVIEDGLVSDTFQAVLKGAGDLVMKDLDVSGDASFLVQGAGDVVVRGIDADNIDAQVQGAGGIVISGADTDRISVVIKGAGDASLSGQANTAVLAIKGAGSIDARGLKAQNYDVTRTGAGSVKR